MADQWYVGRNGQKAGPYTTEQLRQLAAAGQLVPADLLWKQGLETWVPLSQVKGLLPMGSGGVLPPLVVETPARDAHAPHVPAFGARTADTVDRNPYQASTAVAAGSGVSLQDTVLADFLPRVGAYLLDAVFLGVVGTVLQFGLAIALGVLSGGDDTMAAIGSILGSLLQFFVTLFYYVGFETSAKQGTWGKQIVGIRVTDMDGRPITTGRAVGRFFARIITGFTCGIGYLLPLFLDSRQTLHDLICGCLAIKK